MFSVSTLDLKKKVVKYNYDKAKFDSSKEKPVI